MNKKISALLTVSALVLSCVSCGGKSSSSHADSSSNNNASSSGAVEEDQTVAAIEENLSLTEETTAEPTTVHVSPTETISVESGSQIEVGKSLPYTEGNNTIKFELADLIEEGDQVNSFTFVIRAADGKNIGEFKGGCGISVNGDCPSATTKGWFQSPDFSAPTQGTYGEIKWDVPSELKNYITNGGELLFGYWWGGASSITVESVICSFTRTRQVPTDGKSSIALNLSTGYTQNANLISVPLKDIIPDNTIPETLTFDVSAGGAFKKLNCGFSIGSGDNFYQSSPDTAIMTDSSTASVTWFLPAAAKQYISPEAEVRFGYWWSEQPTLTLKNISAHYSQSDGDISYVSDPSLNSPDPQNPSSNSNFRSASQIVEAMNVGWNLGNTLDCYNTGKSGVDTETGWGNPKTSKEMIDSVKNAGFNSIRIPVTWGEHMNGDQITSEWMNRVKEVVDYAYNNDMIVILDMHHDDYIWFTPQNDEYDGDSSKLKKIWTQICTEFADYGDRLIFEGMNEPRTVGSSNEWIGGTSDERSLINKYEQDFVNTVRSSGGNNPYRTIIITSYAASAETVAINDVNIPVNAGNVIFSVHYYAPWKFADGSASSYSQSELDDVANKFKVLHDKFIAKGIPVIIDEFGCVNSSAESIRSSYYNFYISSAKKQGIKCFVWDNGLSSGSGSYAIFNRSSLTWDTNILNSIISAANS
ncbi:MAG TPA: cellulase family glycosylhydrolase [Ruminococcus sp.]|nr:cellulase family glycosylhydrolase [Ruminococcus sp.]